MFAVTSERRLDATPERVFSALVDAERYPEWLIGARAVVVDDDRWPQPGSSFHHEVGLGPIDVQDSTTVVGMEPWRRLDLIVRARPFLEAHVSFEVTPLGSGACVRMTETPRGAFVLLGPLIGPFVRWRNSRSLATLAERMASSSS